jgi:hypothetical protein
MAPMNMSEIPKANHPPIILGGGMSPKPTFHPIEQK